MFITRRILICTLVCLAFAAALAGMRHVHAQAAAPRLFELRTYTAADGKLQVLSDRFRDRTLSLFKKHGMPVVGFWIPNDPPEATNQLVSLMAWPSREVADKTWSEFGADPEWKALVAETEKDGRLWTKLDRVWMKPTDYSVLK